MSRQPESIPAGVSAESGPNLTSSGGTSVSSVGPANWIIEGKFLQGWNTGKQWLQYRLSNNWLPGSSKASTISAPSTKSGASDGYELIPGKQSEILPASSRSSTTDYRQRSNSFSNHRSGRFEQQDGGTRENEGLLVETSWKSVPKWVRQLESFSPEVQSSQGSVGPNLMSVSSTSDISLQRPRPGYTVDEPPTSLSVESLPSMSNLGPEDRFEGLRKAEIHRRTMRDNSTSETSTAAQEDILPRTGGRELLSSHRVEFDIDASFSSCELGSFSNQVNAVLTAHDSHLDSRDTDKSTWSQSRNPSKSLRLLGNGGSSLGEEELESGTPYTSRTTSRSTRTADILDGMSELLQSSGSSSTSFPSLHSPASPSQGYDGESFSTLATTSHFPLAPADELERPIPNLVVRSSDDIPSLSMAQQAPLEYKLGDYQQFVIGPTMPVTPRDITVNMPAPAFQRGNEKGEWWSGYLPVTKFQTGGFNSCADNSNDCNKKDEGQSSYEPLLPNQDQSEHEVENPLWESKGSHTVGRSKDSISSRVAAVYNAYRDRAGRASFVRDHKEKLKRSTCVLLVLFVLLLAGIVAASLLIPRANEKNNSNVEVSASSNPGSIDSGPPPPVDVVGEIVGGTGSPGQPPDIAEQSIAGGGDESGDIVSQGEEDFTPVQAPPEAQAVTAPDSSSPIVPQDLPQQAFQPPPPLIPYPSPPSPVSPTAPSSPPSSQLPIATCSVEEGTTIRNLDSLPVGSRQELLTSIQGPELTTLRTNLQSDECYKIKTALNDYGDGTKELRDFLIPFSSYLIVSVSPKTPARRSLMADNLSAQRQLTANENFGDMTVVYEPGMKNLEAEFSPPGNSIVGVTTSFNINGGGTRTRSFVFDVRGVVESRDVGSNPPDRSSPPTAVIAEPPANPVLVGDLIDSEIAPGIPPETSDLEKETPLELGESPGPSSVEVLTESSPTSDYHQGSEPAIADQGEDSAARVAKPPQSEQYGENDVDNVDDEVEVVEESVALWPASHEQQDTSMESIAPREESIAMSPNYEDEPSTGLSQELSPIDAGLASEDYEPEGVSPLPGSAGFAPRPEKTPRDSNVIALSPLSGDSQSVDFIELQEPPIEVMPHDRPVVPELPPSDKLVDAPEQSKDWEDDEVISVAPQPADGLDLNSESGKRGNDTQRRLDLDERDLETEFKQIVEEFSSKGVSPDLDSHVSVDKESEPPSNGPVESNIWEDTQIPSSNEFEDIKREVDLLDDEFDGPAPAPIEAYRVPMSVLGGSHGSYGSSGSYGDGSSGDGREKTTLQVGESEEAEFWQPETAPMEHLLDEPPEVTADPPSESQADLERRIDEELKKESQTIEELDNFMEDEDVSVPPDTSVAASPTHTVYIVIGEEESVFVDAREIEPTSNAEDNEPATTAPPPYASESDDRVSEQSLESFDDGESLAAPPTLDFGMGDKKDIEDELETNKESEAPLATGPSVVDEIRGDTYVSDGISEREEVVKDENGKMTVDEESLPPSPSPVDISDSGNNLGDQSEAEGESLPPDQSSMDTLQNEKRTEDENGSSEWEPAPPPLGILNADKKSEFVGGEADEFSLDPAPSPEVMKVEKDTSEGEMEVTDERGASLGPAPFPSDTETHKKVMDNENSEEESLGGAYPGLAPSSGDILMTNAEGPVGHVGESEIHAPAQAPSPNDTIENEDVDAVGRHEPEISETVPASSGPQAATSPFSTDNEIEEQGKGASAVVPDEGVTSPTEDIREVGDGEPADEDKELDVQAAPPGGDQRSDAMAIESQAIPSEIGVATSSSQVQKTGAGSSKNSVAAGGDGGNDGFSLWWLWVVMGGVAGIAAVAFYAATHDAAGGRGFRNMSRISPGPEPEAHSEGESSRGSVLPEMDPNSPRGAPTSIAIWSEQERTAKMRADLDSAGHGGPKKRGTEGDPSVLSSVYFPFKTLFGAIHTGINTVFSKGDDVQSEKVIVSPSRSMTPELDTERCRAPDEGPSSRMGEPTPAKQDTPSARSTIPTVPNSTRKESSGGYLGDAMSTGSEIGCSEMDAEEVEEPLIPRNMAMNIRTEGSSMDWSHLKTKNDFQEPSSPSFSPRVAIKEMVSMVSAIYRKVWKKNNQVTSSGTSYSHATSGEQSMHWATKIQGYSAGTSGVSLRTDLPSLESYYAETYGVFSGAERQEHEF
ncbi:hypothetical protein BSKO_06446 [Bryopsis sp. KO-2023]|nr:hypothetical protein BSKO_06446 [Bryopsis sp. KO-2023]